MKSNEDIDNNAFLKLWSTTQLWVTVIKARFPMSTTLKSPQKRRELHPDVPPVNPSPIFQRGSARAHLGDFTLFGLSWGEEGVLGGRRKGGEPLGGTLGRELELLEPCCGNQHIIRSPHQPSWWTLLSTDFLQIRKLRLRENSLNLRHTARILQSWDSTWVLGIHAPATAHYTWV